MCKVFKFLFKLIRILAVAVGALFVVYFWNLDQKLLGWAYVQVNKIFDRKKVPAPPRPSGTPMTRRTPGRIPGLSSWSCCGTPPMSWAAAAKAR